jgi:carboxymethylenebutenolidase
MANLDVRTTPVTILNGDLQIAAYLAKPAVEGSFPGIIVIQEIFGVNQHIREVTEQIAAQGYVAIAPAIYQRQAPGFEVGYSPEEVALGRKYKQQTQAAELLSDIQATLDYLKSLQSVKPDRFGSIGFCFGGHVVYLAATLPEIQATACFYGAGIATGTPGGGPATMTRTSDISGIIYGFFGTEDPLIPNEEVGQIEAELQKQNIRHQIFRYPTGHGFCCDRRDSYNQPAATDAWTHVYQLFQQELYSA